MSYYQDKQRFKLLIEDKLKEIEPGQKIRRAFLYDKGLTLYGFGKKTVDYIIDTGFVNVNRVGLDEEGNIVK